MQVAAQDDYAMQTSVDGVLCKLNFENSLHATDINGTTRPEITFNINPGIHLPLNSGEQVGTAHVVANGKEVDRCNLICSEAVIKPPDAKKAFSDSLWANLKKLFTNI